jgi:hypothetical protein
MPLSFLPGSPNESGFDALDIGDPIATARRQRTIIPLR